MILYFLLLFVLSIAVNLPPSSLGWLGRTVRRELKKAICAISRTRSDRSLVARQNDPA